MRKCYACDSDKTRVKSGKYEDWYLNKGTDLILCERCNQKIIRRDKRRESDRNRYWMNHDKMLVKNRKYRETHREKMTEFNRNRILFDSRVVQFKSNPRTGKCSNCGRKVGIDGIKKTHIHHAMGYDSTDPLFGTVELCVRCHKQAHPKRIRAQRDR